MDRKKTKQSILAALLILAFCQVNIHAQYAYPQDFRSPLDIELDVSGSFCELRSNHFHSGMDLRTNRVEGLNVYAIGDGYISRVKISHFGYGKALYVTHPNGFVSVYAHLSRFPAEIAAYIRSEQYKSESYEIDLNVAPDVLPVTKGQVIGYSGNTGSSQGPHLHFEIRDAKTEETINPLLFGLKMRDNVPPGLKSIRIYPVGNSLVNGSDKPLDLTIAKDRYGKMYIRGGAKIQVTNQFAVGIEASDGHNVSGFKNGLYSIAVELDGERMYYLLLDRMHFDELRYINAHLDYAETIRSKRKIQRLMILPNDMLRNYTRELGNGVLEAKAGEHTVKLILGDAKGNKTEFSFGYEQRLTPPATVDTSCSLPFCIRAGKESDLDWGDCQVRFGEHSLYEDLKIRYSRSDTVNRFGYPYYYIHDPYTPVHRNIVVRIRLKERTPGAPVEKLVIVYINEKGKLRSYGGKITYKDWLTAETNDLGIYTIMADTTAPRIVPVNGKPGSVLRASTGLSFTVTDNLSGIKSYKCLVDGKFVLLEYEHKRNQLFHVPDGAIGPGSHQLELTVTDERGNVAVYRASFQISG